MTKLKHSLKIIAVQLFIYLVLRLIFWFLYFPEDEMDAKGLVRLFLAGSRIDVAVLCYLHIPFWVYYFGIHDFLGRKTGRLIAMMLLCLVNLPLLAINVIDIAYYKFNLRRSTIDLFFVGTDSMSALPSFLKIYWPLLLLFIFVSWFAIKNWYQVISSNKQLMPQHRVRTVANNALAGIVWLLIALVLARGTASRPILPSTALLYAPARYLSVINNSSITVLYSLVRKQSSIQEKNYYTAARLDSMVTTQQKYPGNRGINKMNVVLFIMESFGQDYLDSAGALRATTPFLDSIIKQSIVCQQAYANGAESNKGIVALLGSMPPFLDEPFYSSIYNGNDIKGIGSVLKEEGYSTHFFMGAEKDHFGFGKFGKMLGIDNYVSMEDYGNDRHYDGNWGIYDHYFLPFTANRLKQVAQPFFGTVFTISTHFPYQIPDTMQKAFSIAGENKAQRSIAYLDYALRLFFQSIKNESWYQNTLFVFTADHNIWGRLNNNSCYYKCFRIPLFFHQPVRPVFQPIYSTAQQMDVVPTIMDLLQFNKPFMSFGKSVLDSTEEGWACNKINQTYQLIYKNQLLGYDEAAEQPVYFYDYRSDSALSNNLLGPGDSLDEAQQRKMVQHIKAIIQRYNYSLIHNDLRVRND
jgi:phosphoglycerol transferase MdoB-like AlkP superfamily enzyme